MRYRSRSHSFGDSRLGNHFGPADLRFSAWMWRCSRLGLCSACRSSLSFRYRACQGLLRIFQSIASCHGFSGLETPSLALDALGIDSTLLAASEIAPKLREVIVENFKPDVMHDSFAVEAAPSPGSVDLYVAGPPCQDFSSAGLQAGTSGSRGCLYEQAVDRIIFLRCRAFILENVVGMTTFDKGVFLASMVRKLETAGYCVFVQHFGYTRSRPSSAAASHLCRGVLGLVLHRSVHMAGKCWSYTTEERP